MKHLAAAAIAIALAGPAAAASIIVQSTTSTKNSGLYDHILPIFQEKTGITVYVVSVGTGQAIRNARNCDGDLLLVHAKPDEDQFVADGYGTERTDLMYNDFVIVGPEEDPASLSGMTDARAALLKIATSGSRFASRGDDSGTHKKERALWSGLPVDTDAASGDWYLETGSGMGATLNTGVGLGAYVLTDRATWIGFANKQDYKIVVESDPELFNQYGVIPVNPAKCPSVNAEGARAFADWLVSDEGQETIATFRIDGQQLFFPNAPVAD